MGLKCRSSTGDNLRLLQAAFVGKAGTKYVSSLGNSYHSDDDFLFGVFSRSVNSASTEPATGSALCIFPMVRINGRIRDGIQDCFDLARDDRGVPHIERPDEVLSCADLGVSEILILKARTKIWNSTGSG